MWKRVVDRDRGDGSLVVFVSWTLALALGLTLFYYLHEQLPRSVRASSALVLAPVALVDGLYSAAKVQGIYGKTLPIFLVNCVFAAGLYGLAKLALRWSRRRNV